ncbi:hypothetical protein GCM10011611_44970 [Aliidongia dinghuensis]|uniref:Spermidine synthase n=1 Tax=Aliidongia dinghuensis TaxID=1867774 RepID=A0A8J2YXX4_9PROT|nr:fused MFS/spermidine synthase [Aliidongia dinghuensis]GGF33721.1 hypothetical protein GCM10011611_44970 [Aliidongia dinghuensis]
MMQLLFGVTLFTGAALLFWIQLVVSKMLLPVLGGSAAVWNTCMVFFQVALLLGYLYAHGSIRRLSGRFMVFLHPVLLLAAASLLPVSVAGLGDPPDDANPIPWLLRALVITVGPPFVVLAGTAPLLQAWFARLGTRSSRDPYFLYAASNLGSLVALASYPTLIEPHLSLVDQNRGWTAAYLLLTVLTALSAGVVWHKERVQPAAGVKPTDVDSTVTEAAPGTVPALLRLRWIVLAFVPSSLLLGVTTHLTTDVAAAPLFWVIPLMLYLLSFVLAFQRVVALPEWLTSQAQALLMVALAVTLLTQQSGEAMPLFVLHLAAFFVTALLCHQEVARLRPPVAQLTEFYLLVSVGGALGGIFNALLAPVVFTGVAEYPLVLVLACLLRPGLRLRRDWLWQAAGDALLPVALLLFVVGVPRYTGLDWTDGNSTITLILVILLALVVFGFAARPIRFGLGIAALLLGSTLGADSDQLLKHVRNFYGVLKVVAQEQPPLHVLFHGTTTHGAQSLDPARRLQPLSYYHPDGPLGQLFDTVGGSSVTANVAVVGLGTGTVACYAHTGEHWTFFEINPAVVSIARDPSLFTFVKDCPAAPAIVLGDARRSLAAAPDGAYGMIILDAFTSDAIPIHLMTREAVRLYLAKLRPGGLIVFHISNRYLDLAPVLADIAGSLGLAARHWSDEDSTDDADDDAASASSGEASTDEKDASEWVVVARAPQDLAAIADDNRWQALKPAAGRRVWTDDYSDLIGALAH